MNLFIHYVFCNAYSILPRISYFFDLAQLMPEHGALEVLEQKHAMKVLAILLEREMFKGELASKITIGTASIQARVDELVRLGLLEEEPQTVKPFRKIIRLTDKGREVAEMIEKIEEVLTSLNLPNEKPCLS